MSELVGDETMKITPPKNESIFVVYISDGTITHAITSNKLRDVYYLCEIADNKCVKTKYKSEYPLELEQYIYNAQGNTINNSKKHKN